MTQKDQAEQSKFWDLQHHVESILLQLIWLSDSPRELLTQIKPQWFMSPLARRVHEITRKLLDAGDNLSLVLAHARLDYEDYNKLFLQSEESISIAQFHSCVKIAAENYMNDTIRLLAKELVETKNLALIEQIRSVALDNSVSRKEPVKLQDAVCDVIGKFETGRQKTAYLSGFPALD
ncbi:MAG: hypothetical protein AAB875_05695, partial [Patescibacteria group bacterium]